MGKSTHAISGVFVFLLLGIFAVFSTVMVLMSAKAYKGMVDESALHNSVRVASSYIRTMLRGNDESGVLKVEDEEYKEIESREISCQFQDAVSSDAVSCSSA